MESIPLRKKILETIVSKSTLKQKVFDNTFATFNDLKETLLEMASEMDDQLDGLLDRRVRLEYRVEREALGTAGGVKNCADFYGNDDFLVISGDAA